MAIEQNHRSGITILGISREDCRRETTTGAATHDKATSG
jgi:hypothetical protein